MQDFQERILSFYQENKRDLPWRKTTNRYHIMVSEFMLQQTQVSRVIPKYEAWLEAFPSPSALAAAPLPQILQLWQGLGYNNRAKRLQDSCKIIMTEHNGVVPGSPQELIQLPGIGPYMARSIPIFADNLNIATVDTNIRRILIHEFDLPDTISDKELQELADGLVPQGKSRDWHNALMDYGAKVLTARNSGISPKTKQSKFEGSTRWYRSQILKLLLKQKRVSVDFIKEQFSDCPHNLDKIIASMERDGLLNKYQEVISLVESTTN